MRTPSRSAVILVLAAALALGACGDDDDSDNAEPSGAGARASIEFVETEYQISPSSTREAEGGPFIIDVENDGETTHALEIEGNGLEERTKDLAPGETAALRVDLSAGAYEIYCPIADHADRGMVGSLRVGDVSDSGGDPEPEDGSADDSGSSADDAGSSSDDSGSSGY